MAELAYDGEVDSSQISVTVKGDGVVTLAGSVPTYMQRRAVERVVKRLKGVRAVANDVTVVPAPASWGDTKIAEAAVQSLEWSISLPSKAVRASVSQGRVTLDGEVEWDDQRRAAHEAVRDLPGVRGVNNQVSIKPRVDARDIKEKIEASFTRNAQVDADHVTVKAPGGGKVALSGTVRSWAEKDAAERVASAALGVTSVQNDLTVDAYAYA